MTMSQEPSRRAASARSGKPRFPTATTGTGDSILSAVEIGANDNVYFFDTGSVGLAGKGVYRLVDDSIERIDEDGVADGAEPHRDDSGKRQPGGRQQQGKELDFKQEGSPAKVRRVLSPDFWPSASPTLDCCWDASSLK